MRMPHPSDRYLRPGLPMDGPYRRISWLGRMVGVLCLSSGAIPFSARAVAAQTEDQLTDAFVLAVQRTVGQEYGGRSVFLAPLDGSPSNPVFTLAYDRLQSEGYRLYEKASWPDSTAALVGFRGPGRLRSALEIGVTLLLPERARPEEREGYRPYHTYFRGYVLTCREGACELSEESVHGDGRGLISVDCIPDYFQRSREERAACTVPS